MLSQAVPPLSVAHRSISIPVLIMWVIGWPLRAEAAIERRLVPPDSDREDCLFALLYDVLRDPATDGRVELVGALVDDEIVEVVAISKDRKAKSKEEAVPGKLPPYHVAKRIRRQLREKSGPYWYKIS